MALQLHQTLQLTKANNVICYLFSTFWINVLLLMIRGYIIVLHFVFVHQQVCIYDRMFLDKESLLFLSAPLRICL